MSVMGSLPAERLLVGDAIRSRAAVATGLTRWWMVAALGGALLIVLLLIHQSIFQFALGRVEAGGKARLSSVVATLKHALDRHDRLPRMLTQEPDLIALLQDPSHTGLVTKANARLQFLETAAGVTDIYLMDIEGNTIAAGNWNRPITFVGHNFSFRSYFQDAKNGKTGRYYAVGSVSGDPGYFIAEPVRGQGGAIIGVVTVKVSLREQASHWAQANDAIAVIDSNGVIVLASQRDWQFRAVAGLSEGERARLISIRKYGNQPLEPMSFESLFQQAGLPFGDGSMAVELPVESLGWRAVMLVSTADAARLAEHWTLLAALSFLILAAGVLVQRQRRKRHAERMLAAAALRQLEQELQTRIVSTQDELENNRLRLGEQAELLQQSQRILAETQSDALQAGKLAALGQMAAGISHEINQPLTAITTLSENAVVLLEKSLLPQLRENLLVIRDTARRIGHIVSQLRTFSRKEAARLTPIAPGEVIEAVVSLLRASLRQNRIEVVLSGFDPAMRVLAEETRLHQIFVNLIRNAIEASESVGAQRVDIKARTEADGAGVVIEVRDYGPGIAPEAMNRLFEPFFTTKPSGSGLGLGLALSLGIVRGFGGDLSARNVEGGGAMFTVKLHAPMTGTTP